jgi:aspartyl protease family protein
MIVDTGANVVSLSQEDAIRLGIRPAASEFKLKISTANGIAYAAPFMLPEIVVGDIEMRNVQAIVMPQGALQVSLLGMSFLSRLSHYEVSGGRLVLNR